MVEMAVGEEDAFHFQSMLVQVPQQQTGFRLVRHPGIDDGAAFLLFFPQDGAAGAEFVEME